MFNYIIKRTLIFIPTIIGISLVTFVISMYAPGDPVEQMLGGMQGTEGQASDLLATEQAYESLRAELGLHLPVFYCSLTNSGMPDTLHRIPKPEHREMLKRMLHQHGNWDVISDYYHSLLELELKLFRIPKDTLNAQTLIQLRELVQELQLRWEDERIRRIFDEIAGILDNTNRSNPASPQVVMARTDINALFQNSLFAVYDAKFSFEYTRKLYEDIFKEATPWKKYIPVIYFHGLQNQYHQWITSFIVGDFGMSYQDKRPVNSVVWDALKWTLILSFFAVLITYIVAIPMGVASAVTKGSVKDQFISTFLFILYSLPNFWIATLLIMFLGGGDYLDWFPTYGTGSLPSDAPFMDRFFDTAYHFTLPLVCLTYPTFAFLARQMRGGMLDVLNQDYIRTAKAKGLTQNSIVWKHAFRNSLLPIITMFANVFPYVIVGSFVIEYIFNIPGMGKLTYDAIIARNYPIVLTVVMLASVLTLVGYLVADILYAVVDPRISYSKKNK